MKIIYNNIIPFKGFLAINICGILFVREEYKSALDDEAINHERIHTAQMKELLYVGFYLLYVLEWFVRLFMKGSAYRNLRFEREAYEHENDLSYLDNRKPYSWK